MHNQEFLHKFKSFLEQTIFHSAVIKFFKLRKGGSSNNFFCKIANAEYIIKLVNKNEVKRLERICKILKVLKTIPNFYTASAVSVNSQDYFAFEDYVGIVLEYISGKKIKHHKLSPAILGKILDFYRCLQNVAFDDNIVRPLISTDKLFSEIQKKIEDYKQKKISYLQSVVLNHIEKNNNLILQSISAYPPPVFPSLSTAMPI